MNGRGRELALAVFKRLGQFILVLLVVSVLIFAMVRASNVDPVAVILGGKQTSAETIANLRAKFNLDRGAVEQYFLWIGGMLRGDFGLDFKYQQPVWDLIAARLPITLWMVGLSALFSLVISIPLGVLSAVKKNTWVDRASSLFCLLATACPSFFLSILAIALLANLAPGIPFTGAVVGAGGFLARIVLPAFCLSLSMIALSARILRTGMIEELQGNYIQTARSKGLSEGKILWGHAFKNAVIPLITVSSIQIGSMLVGSVMVETVFSLAGLGELLIASIQGSNYPMTQAITMLMVFVFLLLSTLVDILYAVIDPRIRQGRGERSA